MNNTTATAAPFASREHAVPCQGKHDARHPERTYYRNGLCATCTAADALAVSSCEVAEAILLSLLTGLTGKR